MFKTDIQKERRDEEEIEMPLKDEAVEEKAWAKTL